VTLKEEQIRVVNPDGSLHGLSVKQKATTGAGSALSVDSDHASQPAVLVKGAGDLLDLQTAAGTSRFKVTNAGAVSGLGTVTGPLTVSPAAVSGAALIVKELASQTAASFEVQNSAGTALAKVLTDGTVATPYFQGRSGGTYLATEEAGGFRLYVVGASNNGLQIREPASPTGVPLRIEDSAGTVLLSVTAAGLPKWDAAGNQQTTVGAAGGASALPATPTKYLKVVDSAGTTLVVPAYAAS